MGGRKITPTGRLVTSAAPQSDEWFAARNAGITATDITKILGLSRFGDALSCWAEKTGRVERDDTAGEAAHWGTVMEDTVAKHWAEVNGRRIRKVGVVAHVDYPWMRASCDRLVLPEPVRITDGVYVHDLPASLLEIKCRSAFKAEEWRGEDVPDDVRAQVAWQMAVTGYNTVHVACLLGGNTFVQRTLRYDPDLDEYVQQAACRLWAHIEDGTQPDVPASPLTTSLYDKLYGQPDGDIDLDGTDAKYWLINYRQAGPLIDDLKRKREHAKDELIKLLAGKHRGLLGGKPAFTYTATVRKPYTTTESTTHTFRVTKEQQ